MKFNYQARTKEGEVRIGVVEASSKETALILLQRYGLYVTYLEESIPPFYARKVKIFEKISLRDVVLFSRQLAMMFGSRVPLVEALKTLSGQIQNPDFQEKIIGLSEEVEGGATFSKALSRYPQIFSTFYLAMVKAGEASGKLAESLNYLADGLEREYHLSSKIKGATLYPILILIVVFLVLGLMIFLIVPNFEKLLLGSEAEIPKITLITIQIAKILRKYALLFIFSFFLFFFLIFRYSKTKEGKDFFDNFFLKLPILSQVLKTLCLSRFAQNLSILISGGLLIPQALEITADIVGNSVYKRAIISTKDEVVKGTPMSSTLAVFPEIFPPIFSQMTLVGEKTGALDISLMQIAVFYQKEMEREIDNILSLLEPILLVILGVFVGGLMLIILMPLYQMIAI